jgi:hypothetical protein
MCNILVLYTKIKSIIRLMQRDIKKTESEISNPTAAYKDPKD